MEKNNKRELNLGAVYVFQLATGSIITGVLIGTSENLIQDTVQKYYRLALNESKYIDFLEEEVVNIHTVEIPEDKIGYFKDFESKHGVKCFDSDGECLSGSKILRNITCTDAWEMLSDTEKQELMQYLSFDKEEIIDIIEAYMLLKKENKKLHNDKVRVLDEALELMENYKKYTSAVTYGKNIYDLLFKELGLEKFINSICLR